MKLTWLGHSGFRMEIGDQVLLIDPWLTGNPVLPEGTRDAAINIQREVTTVILPLGLEQAKNTMLACIVAEGK